MAEALKLSSLARWRSMPNPNVGCVIVKEGVILSRGATSEVGGPHAERNALNAIDDSAQGATAYVTLEPCSHTGRTGPCADALIKAGIRRVVYACRDPFSQVAGQGLARLRDAGVEVDGPLLEQEARQLMCGFLSRVERGRPWVTVKSAMSFDGRTAMASGESKWITGPQSRSDVQRIRAQSCAIVTGIESIIADDSKLTVRTDELRMNTVEEDFYSGHQPIRIILDSKGRLDPSAQVLKGNGQAIVVTGPRVKNNWPTAEHLIVELNDEGHLDINMLLRRLAELPLNHVMVEAGATLTASFIQSGLVDEWIVYMAPKLLGSDARSLLTLPFSRMDEAIGLEMTDIRIIGADVRYTFHPESKPR